MKKYALLCVLMSMMSSAHAFEWMKIYENEEFTMFMDRISVLNALNKQQMTSNKIFWEKYLFPSEMIVSHTKREVDCKNYRHRAVEIRLYNISETELLEVDKKARKWNYFNKDSGDYAAICKK